MWLTVVSIAKAAKHVSGTVGLRMTARWRVAAIARYSSQMDIHEVQLPIAALRRLFASEGVCVAENRSIRVDAAFAAMRSNHTLRMTAKRATLVWRTYAAERASQFAVYR